MEYRILGPLEVVGEGGPLALGGPRQRALLAVLLLNAGEVLSTDRIVDDVWGEHPPRTASKSVHVCVSQLRKTLGRSAILTRPPGYVLGVEPEHGIDARRFERLSAEGRALLGAGDPAGAAARLREALALWRGAPLADLAYEPFAQSDIARLEELRLAAVEDRIEAELEGPAGSELVAELEALVARNPLRERLLEQLMVALYRAGRQVDALDVYREARTTLVEELGIEPGGRLRDLERAILSQDPALKRAAVPTEVPTSGRQPAAERPPARDAFVGREPELAEMHLALEGAFDGRGAMVVLGGEPGIGKSRLADEFAAYARGRGARVLWGRCWEGQGAPAYWPWVQLLRSYLRVCDPETVRAQLGPGAGALVELLPELEEVHPDLSRPVIPDPDEARFRLFDAAGSFLCTAARDRPILLVLDDVHAADEPSLLLLQFLARMLGDAPLVVLATYRDTETGPGHPLGGMPAELSRESVVRRLWLGGLERGEVGQYVKLAAGRAVPERVVSALHERTEGNPLFVTELVRLLAAEGGLDDIGGAAGPGVAVPGGVREVIGRRLAGLPEGCSSVLALASVLGHEFDVETLERLPDLADRDPLPAIDEAIHARLVRAAPGAPGRLRFSHALVRDTLYESLPAGRRIELHRRIGEALEARYASDPEPHLATLAHHFFEAASRADAIKAAGYAEGAATLSAAQLAFEEAARLYRLALEAVELAGGGNEVRRCDLVLRLGEALAKAGEMPEAQEAFLRAADLARRLGQREMLARAALGYGGRFVWARAAGDRRLVGLLQEALTALGDEDSDLRARLLARLAGALRDEPSSALRDRLSREAVEVARRLGHPETQTWALDGRHVTIWSPDSLDERVAIADEMLDLARASGNVEPELLAHDYRLYASLEVGDPEAVEAELRATLQLAPVLRQPAYWWKVTAVQALLALLQGRFGEAERFMDGALEFGARSQSATAVTTHTLQVVALAREQGGLSRVDEMIQRSVQEAPNYPLWRCIATDLHCRLGRPDEARAGLEELARDDFGVLNRDEEWLLSLAFLAETCSALSHLSAAETIYGLLLPYSDRIAFGPPEFSLGSVARSLGVLAATLGSWDDAETRFASGLEANERMGARPWVAHTCCDWARMLVDRDGPGDARRAGELLDQGMLAFEELGMATWRDEAAALKPARISAEPLRSLKR